jgi:hypothetical protein
MNIDSVDFFRIDGRHRPGDGMATYFTEKALAFGRRYFFGVIDLRKNQTGRQNNDGSKYRARQTPASRFIGARNSGQTACMERPLKQQQVLRDPMS